RRKKRPRSKPPSSWRSLISIITFKLNRAVSAQEPILQKTETNPLSLPSKADILAFIREHHGKVGTREIARAFGLKNALRAELKRMLRDLADEGSIERRRKKLHQPGSLPSTVLADVTGRD